MTKLRSKRKYNKRNLKKTKKKGGGIVATMKQGIEGAKGNERCNLIVEYINQRDRVFYSVSKLVSKVETSQFLQKEPKGFVNMFKRNIGIFAENNKSEYLKFCTNLFGCIKEPNIFYEVLNDVIDVSVKYPKIKELFDKKKKEKPYIEEGAFINEHKKERAKGMASFMVEALFKSINEYEKKHGENAPNHTVNLKNDFKQLFSDLKINIDYKSETVDSLTNKIIDKENVIKDYYDSKLLSDDSESINENKDKRSPTFLIFIIGLIGTLITIETGLFEAPPEILGSVS